MTGIGQGLSAHAGRIVGRVATRVSGTCAALALAATFTAATLVSDARAQEVQLTFASPYPDALFHVENIRLFIEDLETSSDGRIAVKFYPAQSLFNHSEAMQAVRTGQVDIAELQLTQFANQEELYNVEALPYLAKSFDEAMTLWEIALPAITDRLKQDRIMPLYTVPWPPQAFYANKELKTAADMEGLKFRVYNPIGARMAESMGAEPVLVGGGEVPQAFSTGMIDSMITSSAFGASASAWDYVDVFNDVQAWFGYDQIVMNIRSFQRLPEDLQQVVLDAAARAAERGLQMSKDAHVSEMGTLEKNGMTVLEGNSEFIDAAREATAPIIEDWIAKVGPKGEAIVSEFRSRTQE